MNENTNPTIDYNAVWAELQQSAVINPASFKEVPWLVPGVIPRGDITLLSAEGGIGKTTFWATLVSDITTCRRTLFGSTVPQQCKVLVLSGEDSVSSTIGKKLQQNEANLDLVKAIDTDFFAYYDLSPSAICISGKLLQSIVGFEKPDLLIIDPLQSFLPPHTNMASRSELRAALQPLQSIAITNNCAVLLVCHTNKQSSSKARARIAGSPDLWDYCRSVLMMGRTKDGIIYVSNEKNNLAPRHKTLLLRIDNNGIMCPVGFSDLHEDALIAGDMAVSVDKDKVLNSPCARSILNEINTYHGERAVSVLDSALEIIGYTKRTIRDTKHALHACKVVSIYNTGFAGKKYYISYGPMLDEYINAGYFPDSEIAGQRSTPSVAKSGET